MSRRIAATLTLLSLGVFAAFGENCFFGLSDLKNSDAGENGGKSGDASVSGGTWSGGGSGGKGGTGTGGNADGSPNGGSAGSPNGGSGGVNCADPTKGDCDGNPSNGCETDLTTSSSDCGACGHDCLGGDCVSSKCQAVLLISHDTDDKIVAPYNLAVDANAVYFTVTAYNVGQGYVMKIPLAGATTATVLAQSQDFPWDIALDSTYVYWTDANDSTKTGSVRRIPKAGGTEEILAPSEGEPTGVSVDDNGVFWAVHLTPGGSIRSVAKSGGTPTTLASNQGGAYGTVADPGSSGFIYYTTDYDGLLRKVPKSGGSPTDLTNTDSARAIATDGTSLFFAEFRSGGSVGSVDKSGSGASDVATGQDSPYAVTVDASYVYFTLYGATASDGSVARVPKGGGSVETLATAMNQPTGIAVDNAAIYWIESSAFKIWKLAK